MGAGVSGDDVMKDMRNFGPSQEMNRLGTNENQGSNQLTQLHMKK